VTTRGVQARIQLDNSFEKSLTFKAMIEFNEIKKFSKFRKKVELFPRYHPETVESAQI
jgi:hypothetical protein